MHNTRFSISFMYLWGLLDVKNIRMKKLFGLLILVLATSGFSFDGQVYSLLNNASFEDDNPRASASPAGWTSKTPGSTPDILPGAWGLNIPAHHGKTCIGLVTRDDGSVEDVGQCLEKQLTKGDCFSFSIYLFLIFSNPFRQ